MKKEEAVLEKYDRESVTRTSIMKPIKNIIMIFAVGLSLFHLYTSFAGPLVDIEQRSVHLYILMMLAFLLYPMTKKSRRDHIPFYDLIFAAASIGIAVYMFIVSDRIISTGGAINNFDLIIGMLAIFLVIDAARRVMGWGLPILAITFLIYGFYNKLSIYPALNSHIILNISRAIISHLVYITEGILGTAVGVSASYIILFILFGAFLGKSGMGQLFNDLALAIAGGSKGGPAKVAVIASGFLGSINGSAIANVVTTGTFTIPLMKKVGYHKNFAGAVEAAASVGGQILPPIMGAAAFIMAETLAVPYQKIILAGIIPALLYYFGVLLQVHFRASKKDLKGIPKNQLPKIKEVIAERGHLLIPMFILIFLLFTGKTPFYAAFWSIMTTVIISGTRRMLAWILPISAFVIFEKQILAILFGEAIPHVRLDWWELFIIVLIPLAINLLRRQLNIKSDEMDLPDFKAALEDGARTSISVALACGTVGIVVGVATLTGIALDVANWVVSIGAAIHSPFLQLIITLFFTMIASMVLGMGLPSIPTYIITSTMAAPILLQTPLFRELAGSSQNAIFIAHMFVFYFGIFANLTPPVALAAFAGAGISGGDPNKTGFQAMRLAIAGFIVPYMFVFSHQMLMIDASLINIIITAITSIVGVLLLSIAVEGYFKNSVSIPLRFLFGIFALLLIYPGIITDLIGIIGAVLLLVLNTKGKQLTSL